MLQLCIDTSTEHAFVAIAHQEEVLHETYLPVGVQNSKLLFPALLALLDEAKLTPRDLGIISCGIGPGSYTGIRVGAAAAQSMAYALRIPLVGLSSLEAFIPRKEGRFAVMLDARIGGIYFMQGEVKGGQVQSLSASEALQPSECMSRLKKEDLIITPHLKAIRSKIEGDFQIEEGVPSAALFAKRAFAQYSRGEFSNKGKLELLYLRKTEAEIEHC